MLTFLVTQANGQQSTWVITHLLAAGARVHAVVRDTKKLTPTLQEQGVTVFQGDSTDFDSIFRAAQGCKGVFLVTYPIPELEDQQARTVVAACIKAGVERIVATTTVSTGDKGLWDNGDTKKIGLWNYFRSKSEVEDAVRNAGFQSYTIFRPGFIQFDYLLPSANHNFPELSSKGEMIHAYNEGARMLHIDGSDIGKFATAALQNPTKFNGEEIELCNEYLSIHDVHHALEKVSGRAVQLKKRTPEETEAIPTSIALFHNRFHLWCNIRDLSDVAAAAQDVQSKFGMSFTSLEESLERDRDRLLETLPE